MKTVTELSGEIKAKRDLVHKSFEQAGESMDFEKVSCLQGKTTEEKIAEIGVIEKQLNDLHDEYTKVKKLADLRKSVDEAVDFKGADIKNEPKAEAKGLGAQIKASGLLTPENGALVKNRSVFLGGVDLKTLFETAAGWAPMVSRLPGYVGSPVAQPSVLNFIPQYTTNQNSIKYMLESAYTATNTVEKAEGTALGEAAFALTETNNEVEKLGAYVPVTDVQLEDEPSVGQYLEDRLVLQIKNRIESQILFGTGVTPLLLGTNALTAPNTQAKGADTTPDAFYKAIVKVQSVGFAQPNVIFIHPNDWQPIRLLTTADGIYIFGNPMDAGPNRMWGLPVCVTTACTENTGLVGDYANYSAFFWRKGIEIAISSGYSTYFTEGKQAVRATVRCSMVHFRDKAFATVTGI